MNPPGDRFAVLGPVEVLGAGQPLRERLCGQLMLALHRAGRQAEALAAARAFRTALADQQGLDASRAFGALEQAILRDDPTLDYRPAAAVSPAAATGDVSACRRRQVNFLPYDTRDFAGRAAELDRLASSGADAGVAVWLIDGMAGVGKTTLAVHAAHQLVSRFPDGQLFIDLQAHTPGREPVAPGTALDILLRQLGTPPERVPQPGRYIFHDLLREHARGTASAEESPAACHDAMTRLIGYYLQAAGLAVDTLFPLSKEHRPELPEPAGPSVPLADASEAIAWLDAERANLIAIGTHAAAGGWPGQAIQLASTLDEYLYDHGHHTEEATLEAQALRASRRVGDPGAEARALINLAWVSFRQGRYGEAEEHARQAREISQACADRYGQARALNALGNLCSRQRDYAGAHQHFRRALDIYTQLCHRVGETHALGNIGIVYERPGRYELAAGHLRQALDRYRELGDQGLEEAIARTHLGAVCRRQGRYQEARRHHQRALEVFRELGNRSEEADARNGLGEAALAMGDPGQAVTDHDAALTLARAAGNLLEQGRANLGLARAHRDLGHGPLAREHASKAGVICTALGLPEAGEVRDSLASLG